MKRETIAVRAVPPTHQRRYHRSHHAGRNPQAEEKSNHRLHRLHRLQRPGERRGGSLALTARERLSFLLSIRTADDRFRCLQQRIPKPRGKAELRFVSTRSGIALAPLFPTLPSVQESNRREQRQRRDVAWCLFPSSNLCNLCNLWFLLLFVLGLGCARGQRGWCVIGGSFLSSFDTYRSPPPELSFGGPTFENQKSTQA